MKHPGQNFVASSIQIIRMHSYIIETDGRSDCVRRLSAYDEALKKLARLLFLWLAGRESKKPCGGEI